MLKNNGIKIMNLEAGEIFGYINGTRKYYETKDGVLSNSLLLEKFIKEGIEIVKGRTRDVVSLSFSFGSEDAEGECKRLDKAIMNVIKEDLKNEGIKRFYSKKLNKYKEMISEEALNKIITLEGFKEDVNLNADKYKKISAEDIRKLLYEDKFSLTFKSYPQLIKNNSQYSKELATELKEIRESRKLTNKEKSEKIKEFNNKLICKEETITYKMLFRSPAKARIGNVTFVNEELYDVMHNWMCMGMELPLDNAKIVEMGAYSSLVSSTIIGKIKIPVEDVLIVQDLKSLYTSVIDDVYLKKFKKVRRKYNIAKYTRAIKGGNYKEIGTCGVRTIKKQVANTLWDGMGIIESDLLDEKDKKGNTIKTENGMALFRQHFFKACLFRGYISKFFKKFYGDEYDTAEIIDMFGVTHKVNSIKIITTNNAIKWLKFKDLMGSTDKEAYEYWCEKINKENSEWGICKIDHKSKLSIYDAEDNKVLYQQSSYQMINSLQISKEKIENICKDTIEYVNSLKDDNDKYIDFLEQHKATVNLNECLIALYKHNKAIANTSMFRYYKSQILNEYKKKIKKGKILTKSENLTVCGNPYMLLQKVVGQLDKYIKDDVISGYNDETLPKSEECVSCYAPLFDDKVDLAGFRSPHNSPNAILLFKNYKHDLMVEYFNFSNNIIAVNLLENSAQARCVGFDEDSDAFYTTMQEDIVSFAKESYKKYRTIENSVPQSTNSYKNTMSQYAKVDSLLQEAKLGIGLSSNLSQLALSYYYTEKDEVQKDEYRKIYSITAIIAQICIDNAKRQSELNINRELKRIQNLECMKKNKPLFWKSIKKGLKEESINFDIECPMNYLVKCIDKGIKNASTSLTDDILDFILPVDGKAKSEQMDSIVRIIKGYDDLVKEHNDKTEGYSDEEAEDWFEKQTILAEEVTNKIGKLKITDKTLNRLIVRALTDNKDEFSCSKYRAKLLNAIYRINKKRFLNNFIKGE